MSQFRQLDRLASYADSDIRPRVESAERTDQTKAAFTLSRRRRPTTERIESVDKFMERAGEFRREEDQE